MAKRRSKIRCIFCEEWRKPSREDVFPKWIARELGEKDMPVRADLESFRKGQLVKTRNWKPGSLAAFKVPKVCEECNNVWLSGWEDAAKPILLPMFHGQDMTLGAEDRDLVATWSFKTALTYDAYYDLSLVPSEISAPAFYENDRPLGATRVLLGVYESAPDRLDVLHARNAPRLLNLSSGAIVERPIRFTFVFKNLLIRVLAEERVDRPPETLGPADADLLEIWPDDGRTLTWPFGPVWDYNAVRRNA